MSPDPDVPPAADEEQAAPGVRGGRWWIAALLAPVICTGIGFVIGLCTPRSESDWMGASFILPLFLGFLLGTILCAAFAAVSVAKREKRRGWALLVGVPALFWVIVSAVGFIHALINKYK